MTATMRGLLFLSALIALANCQPTLDAIIDAKLKQYENDAKMNTASVSGRFDFSYGVFRYYYSIKLFGVSTNVKRTSEATVTKMDDGALVQWQQQEPDLHFNGTMTSVIYGSSSTRKATGSIAQNPAKVQIRQLPTGRFKVTVHWNGKGVVKRLKETLPSADTEHLADDVNHVLSNSPFWTNVDSSPEWGIEWPELDEYLEQARA
ncbi:hypothetical protein HDE_09808 [Halotydeus destructor]|nr:hypothetical protein HDE_09808 [Halotydeus destructor]